MPEQVEEVVEVVNPNQQQGDTQRRFCNDRFGQAATIRLATGASATKKKGAPIRAEMRWRIHMMSSPDKRGWDQLQTPHLQCGSDPSMIRP